MRHDFAIIAVTLSCPDITCKSIPGSSSPFLFFIRARGEPGNKATRNQEARKVVSAQPSRFKVCDNLDCIIGTMSHNSYIEVYNKSNS